MSYKKRLNRQISLSMVPNEVCASKMFCLVGDLIDGFHASKLESKLNLNKYLLLLFKEKMKPNLLLNENFLLAV